MSHIPSDFSVLDVHHHVGDALGALGGQSSEAATDEEAALNREMEQRLAIMDAGGVAQALVIPGHGYLRPRGHENTQAQNDRIAAYRDLMPERFPGAIGVVEPRDGDLSFDELQRIREELGLIGVSFHTRFQGVSLESTWIRQYVSRMTELELVPVLHAIDETPDEALWKVTALAREFSDTRMLVLDAFASYESTRHCFFAAEIAPNLLFDTSLSYNFDFIEQLAERFGPDRVVFGTDLYSAPVGRRISHLLPQILDSSLPHEALELILGGNARRLFGLPSHPKPVPKS
ncbi:amidohydrolase family protein [Myxococcota bacterium]|nr:amidohydrolase family protein [Myxococcota bacterium]